MVRIFDTPLCEIQRETLEKAGVDLVEEPPKDEPYILISDRIWFTYPLIELLKKHRGRLCIKDSNWHVAMHPLQELGPQQAYDIAVLEAGEAPQFDGLPLIFPDLEFREGEPLELHEAMRHALRPVCLSPYMAHHIDHWSHILRVNQIAIIAQAEETRYRWRKGGFFAKIGMVLGFLWRIRSFSKRTMLARIGEVGKNCKIHPTAVIEACKIGDNVEIGPHAVVRASVIGDGAKIDEHTSVNLSVIGKKARVGRAAIANLSVLYPNVMLSYGQGFQGCLFGEGAFIAIGVVALDLSFGKPIRVENNGEWVDSGMHFLGIAVGHRAALGNGARFNYGVSIPNDALLVGPKDGLYKDASQAPPKAPSHCVDGKAVRLSKQRSKNEKGGD
ncbi:MAG: hypothetical protein VX278_20535 [Myxococcota bacterium]|nr:hypothetical protein [Myxococcota bacterium]